MKRSRQPFSIRACAAAMAVVLAVGMVPLPAFATSQSASTYMAGELAAGILTADTTSAVKGGMHIENGMAQPVFAYSDVLAPGYSNANSELYRFCVYVETDYDTDRDGKCDLVKTYIQVPRAAVEGAYKAPVIFEADPYSAGIRTSGNSFKFADSSVSDADLMGKPAHRTASGATTTKDLALDPTKSVQADWNYELNGQQYPSGVTELDYYLVRGFAVVRAAGLGTYGSEGIECCGTVMERDAFVDIVEWLHGTSGRTAFADAAGTIEVKATDWSSGRIGMTGLSYPGAMCYEVATSGVEGLETVVPVAGPSSWYDRSNSQGICKNANTSYNYTTILADTCAGRLFEHAEEGLLDLYQRYRTYLRDSQGALQGDYGPYWQARDWYTGQTGIKASALIVTGLNDTNVTTKHFDLMRDAFLASGCEVKALLHQNEHMTPADESTHSDIMIGNHTYREWLNLWFSRSLLDVENEAAQLPAFTVQSNVDGSFYGSDRWNAEDAAVTLRPSETGETTVSAKGALMGMEELLEKTFTGKASKNAALWSLPVSEQFAIAGKIPVHVRAKVDDVSDGDIMMSAVLVDVADSPFASFAADGSVGSEVVVKGDGTSLNYDVVRWTQGKTTKKVVSVGRLDLRNPEAGYEPATATKRAEPIRANEYYDYTIWLDPTYYTVQPGHRLELYLVPFFDYVIFPDAETRDYMLAKQGLDSTNLMNIRTDYSFTIANAESYAMLSTGATQPLHDIAGADIASVANRVYTGQAIQPTPKVAFDGRKLVAGIDYELYYRDNVNAGKAIVAVVGKGLYAGVKTTTFRIVKASVKKAKVAYIPVQAYTGKVVKPDPVITYRNRILVKGSDYKLQYKNNKKRGTAKIVIKGLGNFKGRKVVTFKIR